MKITCALSDFDFKSVASDLNVVMYSRSNDSKHGTIGAMFKQAIIRAKLNPSSRAWDLLSLAFAVISADLAGHRKDSPDGWTREFNLTISVNDPLFWSANVEILQNLLGFLTTDRWFLQFIDGGMVLHPSPQIDYLEEGFCPQEDSIVLLSGGLDSYIGALDLVEQGKTPIAVSQMVRGDGEKQVEFAATLGNGLRHFQLNHNAKIPHAENPASQRARSIIFLAYGVLCRPLYYVITKVKK